MIVATTGVLGAVLAFISEITTWRNLHWWYFRIGFFSIQRWELWLNQNV